MHIIRESIDRSANRAVLKSAHHEYPNATVRSSSTMSLDINHHCPVCAKKGNRRCVKLGHLIECEIHRGKYHSRIHECVSCAEACAREAKAAKKDDGSCSAEDENKQQQKSKKSGKVKGTHEKTMKQIRREKREKRSKSSSD